MGRGATEPWALEVLAPSVHIQKTLPLNTYALCPLLRVTCASILKGKEEKAVFKMRCFVESGLVWPLAGSPQAEKTRHRGSWRRPHPASPMRSHRFLSHASALAETFRPPHAQSLRPSQQLSAGKAALPCDVFTLRRSPGESPRHPPAPPRLSPQYEARAGVAGRELSRRLPEISAQEGSTEPSIFSATRGVRTCVHACLPEHRGEGPWLFAAPTAWPDSCTNGCLHIY